MEAFLMEKKNLKLVTLPVDANTAAITGGRISLKNAKRVAFVVQFGDSTAATVQFALKQHNAATSGTTKALSIANPYYHKAGAATTFTKVTPTAATDAYDLGTIFGDAEGIVVFEVLPEDLDVNGGFTHASIDLADSGAAKLVSVLAAVEPKSLPAYEDAV